VRALVFVSGMIFLASFMVTLGLRLTPELIREELARPGRLARGLALNIILVPLATALCLRVLGVGGRVASGLIALAVSPGAPLATSAAKAARGNAHYAVVLTVLLGVITAFTAPPSARWLLSYEGQIDLRPPVVIGKLALLQWLPLAIGMLLQRRSPVRATALGRITRAIVLISGGVLVLGSLVPVLPQLHIIGWGGLAAILLSMAIVVGLAWLAGGRDRGLCRSLAATVSVPNPGLATALARAANAPQPLLLTIAAGFIVRLLANQILIRILARTGARAAEQARAAPPHGSVPAR
jgi:BASS family bile acid:Na+ symporter